MKRGAIALLVLLVLATGIVALAGEPTGLPIEYEVLSPLTVGAMHYFPNEGPPEPNEVWHDLMCNGSFDHIDAWECWNWTPELSQVYNVGRDYAFDGSNVVIQGLEYDADIEQFMQCWPPGSFDDYLGFVLWVGYRLETNEPPWIQCAWSHALLIKWVEEGYWGRISPDLWYFMNWAHEDNWTWIQTYLPGLEAHRDSLVCLLVEGEHGCYPTEFWYDDFRLLAHPVQDRVFMPFVSKNQ